MASSILGLEESMEILEHDHAHYTYECCPSIPTPTPRVQELLDICGEFDVTTDTYSPWINYFKKLLYSHNLEGYFYNVVEDIEREEFYNNKLSDHNFQRLQDQIKLYNVEGEKPFTLVKKSPKISNWILSLQRHDVTVPRHALEWEELLKEFNDRGTSRVDDYELIVSTEPHAIAGMSAYGKFTSCQDWIEKTPDSDTHNYTHQAWANLLDPTCGIAYIKKRGWGYENDEQFMLARALIRVLPLKNGEVVVYLGRKYARAPFDIYLMESLKTWKQQLPKNYHVIDLWDFTDLSEKNSLGQIITGTEWVSFPVDNLSVMCINLTECDDCGGSGEELCLLCEGTGKVNYAEDGEEKELETCPECYGSGSVICDLCDGTGKTGEEEIVFPYNDFTEWINFNYTTIDYQVPICILKWKGEENEDEEDEELETATC